MSSNLALALPGFLIRGHQYSKRMPYDVIKNFQKEVFFMGQTYLRVEDQKPGA